MPQYYPMPEGWGGRGKMVITPIPSWRNIPILNKISYHVGDRVMFRIQCEKTPEPNMILGHAVYEVVSGKVKFITTIDETDQKVVGNRISASGDVAYQVGLSRYPEQDKETIFTASVENWDTVLSKWFWMILAALLGGVVALIGGYCWDFWKSQRKGLYGGRSK